ncbi:hypothetical protein TL18_02345 [Methanobrevibacter sp. YE315]|uniref:hypothetical protein n=1 Tax=Methanobrevibacter sp. YE315 TaxID=1609968 RepID=UPI000764D0E1|nr:hypothetical protein [Methanobrevibacter sp. YE315]AMD16964.1 hypothetical protein TL18_02345 [Methanobrevibacter sp. YE315]
MSDEEIIKVNDINYAIYKIGKWENDYEINQIGLSNEIPVTKSTLNHVKWSMDEIRSSKFALSDKEVNGFIAISFHLNPKIQEMDVDDVIELEEKEYNNILAELNNLELLDEDDSIPLNGEDYLIYKLEKDCHVTKSTPANEFTRQFHNDELKKIEDALN